MSHWSSPLASSSRERSSSHTATPWADSSASGSWRVLLVMFGPSGSGRAVGGAADGHGKVTRWPLARVPFGASWMLSRAAAATAAAVMPKLAVQGLALSGGALMFGADAAVGVPDDLSQPLLTPAYTLTRATNRGGLMLVR